MLEVAWKVWNFRVDGSLVNDFGVCLAGLLGRLFCGYDRISESEARAAQLVSSTTGTQA